MTLFEALTGGAVDRLNWQHGGEFDQNFSKKSNAPGFARGGGGGMGGFGIDPYISSLLSLFMIDLDKTENTCVCLSIIKTKPNFRSLFYHDSIIKIFCSREQSTSYVHAHTSIELKKDKIKKGTATKL